MDGTEGNILVRLLLFRLLHPSLSTPVSSTTISSILSKKDVGRACQKLDNTSTIVRQHPWELNLLPSMQLLMLCIGINFEFYKPFTMTSLQFTQAQGLGYTRGMCRVPLSIQTYDSDK